MTLDLLCLLGRPGSSLLGHLDTSVLEGLLFLSGGSDGNDGLGRGRLGHSALLDLCPKSVMICH